MKESFSKLNNAINKIKHKELFIAVIMIVLLVLLYFLGGDRVFLTKNDGESHVGTQAHGYCDRMVQEVTDAVKLMTGSNKCKVIINWGDGGEDIIAYTTSITAGGETKSPQIVTVNGVSSPIILKEDYPTALSVAVVCPKSTSIETRLNIKYLINTLLQVNFDDIAIYSC